MNDQLSLIPHSAPKLRPYQTSAIDHTVRLILEPAVRAVLLVAPTGAGKTVLGAELIRLMAGKRVLFLAPRRELVGQTCNKLDDVGVRYGVLLAGDPRQDLYRSVQVASVDTIVSRALRKGKLQLAPFDLIIIDEAHLGLTARRAELLALWPQAKIVGLTATPCRADGKGMGQMFDEMVEVASVSELTEQGFLVKARYFSVHEPDLRKVRTTAGDFNGKDLEGAMNQPKLVGNIVEHWLRHAAQRRTVVFATSISHSVALAQEFISHGISAEHVDANTPNEARKATFERFRSGATQVLTNCTLASIGFDLPELDCVVFARPTKSLGLYLQMLGRGLRPATGKADCLVLDHAGNVHRHGFATAARYWTLHGEYAQDQLKLKQVEKLKELKQIKQITCPKCKTVWEGRPVCPECGWFAPAKPKPLPTADGSLVEISEDRRPKPSGDAISWSVEKKRLFFLELAGHGEARGYQPGWAKIKFKERCGYWPERPWTEHVTKHGGIDPTPETAGWIKAQHIAWMRGNERKAPSQRSFA